MKIRYNRKANRVVDYLMVPTLLKIEYEDDYFKRVLGSEYSIFKEVIEQLNTKKKKINQCYLSSGTSFFILQIIEYMDEIPETVSETLAVMKALSEEEIRSLMYQFLLENNEQVEVSKNQLFDLLEDQAFSEEKSWYWARAIQQPKRMIQEMIEIIEWVADFYEPFYNQTEVEREKFYQTFDLQAIIDRSPMIHIDSLDDLPFKEGQLFLLSPFFPYLMMLVKKLKMGKILVGMRHTDHWEANRFSDQKLFEILKLLSDETRYQVLKLTAQTHLKAKDIAQQLGISSAAVSYHVSKLVENSLLVLEIEEGSTSAHQVINQTLIRQIIEKLQEDLVNEKA